MKYYFVSLVLGTILANCVGVPSGKIRHYHGYKILRIYPETSDQQQAILKLGSYNKYDFWKVPNPLDASYDIMVSPQDQTEILPILDNLKTPYKIHVSNVEDLLVAERQRKLLHASSTQGMDWHEYHTLDEVNTWLSELVLTNSLITAEKYGTSYEGRDLLVYKVSSGPGNKVGFFIDATIHAREHITTAVITYIINELVQNSTKYADILSHNDFYFVPFVNPDGYVYTHEVDRMWRKTRSNWGNHSEACIGVDANRNFGFHWGEPAGASNNPCSGSYHGPEPYSEPETKSMRDYILAKKQQIKFRTYVTLHSYSQLWIHPWGYTMDLPETHDEMLAYANAAVAELKSHFNTSYVTGTSSNVLYYTSGTSQDWAYSPEAGFNFSYTIELRDTGRYGFLLPPEQILDTAVETWAGIQVLAKPSL